MKRWLVCGAATISAACQWLAPLPEKRFATTANDAGQSGGGASSQGDVAPQERLPGLPKSAFPIAVASLAPAPTGAPLPELELIWTTGQGVHHLSRKDGLFGAQTDLGGAPVLPPVALASRIEKLDLFIAEANGSVKHRLLEDGSWSPFGSWNELGGSAKRSLSATGDRERMDLFAVDDDGRVWHRHWQRGGELGSWGDWLEVAGATADGRVAVTSPRPSIVEAVLRQGGELFWRVFDGGTSGKGWSASWSRIKACTEGPSTCPCSALVADPEIVSIDTGRVDIVFDSGQLFHLWHTSDLQWQCEPLDQTLPTGSRPALVSRELGRLDLLAPTGDTVSLRSWSSAAWSEWSTLDASFRDLSATSPNPSALFVVGRAADDAVEYLEWDGSSGWVR